MKRTISASRTATASDTPTAISTTAVLDVEADDDADVVEASSELTGEGVAVHSDVAGIDVMVLRSSEK